MYDFDAPFLPYQRRKTIAERIAKLIQSHAGLQDEIVLLARGPRTEEDQAVFLDWCEDHGVGNDDDYLSSCYSDFERAHVLAAAVMYVAAMFARPA